MTTETDRPADPAPATLTLHASCVAVAGTGVLLRGPSGAGKSDLALRLIDRPGRGSGGKILAARLVADDQVVVSRQGDDLVAAAPPRLAGLLEVRGLGIVHLEPAGPVRLGLVVDLAPAVEIERYPAAIAEAHILGCPLPLVVIDATTPSAAARVRATLCHLVLAPARR